MTDQRYSVMILPRHSDGSILLQTWVNKHGTITDGFGCFYKIDKDPEQIAQNVVIDNLNIKATLSEAAWLQYYIDKPSGIVNLKITVYFANITKEFLMQKAMHWVKPTDVPYEQMHPATSKWLTLLMDGHIPLRATIKVSQPGDHTAGLVTSFVLN